MGIVQSFFSYTRLYNYQDRTDQVIEDCREVFELFDKDGDGTVTTKELDTVMRSLGHTPTHEEIKEMVARADADGSGSIEFPEFLTMITNIMKDIDIASEVREAFRLFDSNGDGYITACELYSIFRSFGEKISDEELLEIIDGTDVDGDGKINYEEFVRILD